MHSCAWVRFHPTTSFSLSLSFSTSSGQPRAQTDLSSRHISHFHHRLVVEVTLPPFLLSSPSSSLRFLIIILFLQFPHRFSTLILRIAHSAQTPAVAGSKRNYSYLPPALSDSRLFRGGHPSPLPPPLSPHSPTGRAILFLSFSFSLARSLSLPSVTQLGN